MPTYNASDVTVTQDPTTGRYTAMWTLAAESRLRVSGCPAGTGATPDAATADLVAHTRYIR